MPTIERVAWDHPAAAALRREMYDDLAAVYPDSVAAVEASGGYGAYDARGAVGVVAMLVARVAGGRAVGCAAVRRTAVPDDAGQPREVAELRRMFVRPEHRGTGLARELLAEAEVAAVSSGLTTMVIETGLAQPAAIRMYAAAGYRRTAPFPPHVGDPDSVCFAKELGQRG